MVGPEQDRDALWEDAGRRVAAKLDGISSAVVVGRDGRAVALAALGIARMQASRRRVAVGDLIGESEPLQSLVTDDDVHGIVDSFVYGVSLNRIARQVKGYPNLFILPSGSEPIAHDEVFRNPRWRRLSGGFQEVGALLLLAVTDDSPALPTLIENTEGAVLVGTEVVLGPDVRTIATVVPQRGLPPLITPERGVPGVALVEGAMPVITPTSSPARPRVPRAKLARAARLRLSPGGRRLLTVIAAGAAVGLAAAFYLSRSTPRVPPPVRPDSGARVASSRVALPDSAAQASGLLVVNPDDSARAAGWSVRVVAHNTEAGAMLTVRDNTSGAPGLTYAPVIVGTARWYQVFAGGFPTRAAADSLLTEMRINGEIPKGQGQVAELPLPLAFRLRAGLSGPEAVSTRKSFLGRRIPAYPMVQDDGTVTLYAGAYENEAHAALALTTIRSAFPDAELAFRTGRP